MSDAGEKDEWESTWHGLDEGQFRLQIRGLLNDIMIGESGGASKLARQFAAFHRIVEEELASSFQSPLNLYIRHSYSPPDLETARQAVEWVGKSLGAMGLAIKHPETGAPTRLAITALPPTGPTQSWLQLEPLDPAPRQRPHRLAIPYKGSLDLVPVQRCASMPGKPSPDR